jgi:hypothetical protein
MKPKDVWTNNAAIPSDSGGAPADANNAPLSWNERIYLD